MRVLLTTNERLKLFVPAPPQGWEFTFEPRLSLGDEIEFIEPVWGRKCARATAAIVTFNRDRPKQWRVILRDFTDLRERKAAALEDGRVRLLGIGARLQGMRPEYNDAEVLRFMLRLAMLATEDRKKVQEFIRANEVPQKIRGLGYRQIVDDLYRALEIQ